MKVLPVSLEEVSVAGWLPPDSRIYPVIRNITTKIHQLLWIAVLKVSLPENPEPVS